MNFFQIHREKQISPKEKTPMRAYPVLSTDSVMPHESNNPYISVYTTNEPLSMQHFHLICQMFFGVYAQIIIPFFLFIY